MSGTEPDKVTLDYLANADLSAVTADGVSGDTIKEAAKLSSIKKQIATKHFKLYAIVHEVLAVSIQGFSDYFEDGDGIFLDSAKTFYGPKQRWMGVLAGSVRPSVWKNIRRAKGEGFQGNMSGEGRLLGGVFVIGAGNEGILLEHQETEYGDSVKTDDVLKALGFEPESNTEEGTS